MDEVRGVVIVDRIRIDVLMHRQGIKTYLDLADAADIHRNTLIRILKGAGFNSKSVARLATALECSPLDLISVSAEFPDPSLGQVGRPLVVEYS